MLVGMAPDIMTLCEDAVGNMRMLLRAAPQHEESRLRVVRLQQVQKSRSNCRAGTVIIGQSDNAILGKLLAQITGPTGTVCQGKEICGRSRESQRGCGQDDHSTEARAVRKPIRDTATSPLSRVSAAWTMPAETVWLRSRVPNPPRVGHSSGPVIRLRPGLQAA